MKIIVTLTMDIDEVYCGDDTDALEWFLKDVMAVDQLHLISNEIGDEIEKITSVEVEVVDEKT